MPTLAAIQMVSTASVAANLATATRLIADAASAGATLVTLPEYFCLMGTPDADRLAIGEEPGVGPIQQMLSAAARHHAIWLLGGTVPLRVRGMDRVRNASVMFAPDGTLAARYDKIHLFAFDDGHDAYDEATVLDPGVALVSVQADGLRVGLSVCYDLRFPELYRALTYTTGQPPLDLICAPSAFTHATGQHHWELLVRARAVENQCYVMASAQGGVHADGRRTWGHTMIVDPWGDILDCVAEGDGMAIATFDAHRLHDVRTRLPALSHRRL
jgi:deaminated glutathione amidase